VTDCILQDIKARGHDFTSAYILAKRFETRRCPHKDKPVSGYDCIRDLVGAENHQHFCVASQNPKLKDRMRKIPGVPVIHVNVKGNSLGIEPMTEKETARLKRALYAPEEEKEVEQAKPKPKKRKVKGVNPLAMKKKKKKAPPPPKKKTTEKK
jgi:U3 small nucleolar RNA-associated protein 23